MFGRFDLAALVQPHLQFLFVCLELHVNPYLLAPSHPLWLCLHRYTQHCLLQRRSKDAATAWHRQRRSFLADTQALLEELSLVQSQQVLAAGQALAWEVAAEQRHNLLEQLRADKQEREQVRILGFCRSQKQGSHCGFVGFRNWNPHGFCGGNVRCRAALWV